MSSLDRTRREDDLRTGAGETRPGAEHPTTPDGRYFVVRGRLWRTSDPGLSAATRASLVSALMEARRAVGNAKRSGAREDEAAARADVDRAKRSLGERGPVWWDDGAPDFNRHLAKNTPYALWWAEHSGSDR